MEKRRILICTGNGKGKTTSALGMTVRALGHGKRVLFTQFIKTGKGSGEANILSKLSGVTYKAYGKGFVSKKLSSHSISWEEHRQAAEEGLCDISKLILENTYDLLVLDEICNAVDKGLLEEERVLSFLQSLPQDMDVVMTGRGASQNLIKIADTVTEMLPLKHAYDEGVPAKKRY